MSVTIVEIEKAFEALKARYEQGKGQLELLTQQKKNKEMELWQAEASLETWRKVQMLFTLASEYAREQLKTRIEETVTAALAAVFNQPLEFKIDIKEKSGQPVAEWVLVSPYGDLSLESNPEDSNGGGVVDVISLALRLAMMELTRPKVEGPLILDEIGKMISAQYAPNVAYFLKQYAEKVGRQIIMVTHNEALADVADVVYRVSKDDGSSKVVMVNG